VARSRRRDGAAELAKAGHEAVLLVPIGFVCDHVEILYDIDVEYQALSRRLGIQLERTRLSTTIPASSRPSPTRSAPPRPDEGGDEGCGRWRRHRRLTAAWELLRGGGVDVTVLEAERRAGG